jgi:hypothetical protein
MYIKLLDKFNFCCIDPMEEHEKKWMTIKLMAFKNVSRYNYLSN